MRPATKWSMILVLLLSVLAGGCNWLQRETYIRAGQVAEVREPAKVAVWVHDKDGVARKSFVRVWPGWLVGPEQPTTK